MKITDYGCSKRLTSLSKNWISNVETKFYKAAEILEGEGKKNIIINVIYGV